MCIQGLARTGRFCNCRDPRSREESAGLFTVPTDAGLPITFGLAFLRIVRCRQRDDFDESQFSGPHLTLTRFSPFHLMRVYGSERLMTRYSASGMRASRLIRMFSPHGDL